MRRTTVIGSVVLLSAGIAWAQDAADPARKAPSLEALRADIQALKAPMVAWRRIDWQSCLLEGLRQSRAQNKPALLWVFIDRPVDDARC